MAVLQYLPDLPLENVMSVDHETPFEMHGVCRRFREKAKELIAKFDKYIVDDIRFYRMCKQKRIDGETDVDYDIFEIVKKRWFRTCMWIWIHIDQLKFIKEDKRTKDRRAWMVDCVTKTHDIRFIKWWYYCGGKNCRNMITSDDVYVSSLHGLDQGDNSDEVQFYFDKKIFPEELLDSFIYNCLFYEHLRSFDACLKYMVACDKKKKKLTSIGEAAVIRTVVVENLRTGHRRNGHSPTVFKFLTSKLKSPLTPDEILHNNAAMWFARMNCGDVEGLELLDEILKKADKSITCNDVRENSSFWECIIGVIKSENKAMFKYINDIVRFDLDEIEDELKNVNDLPYPTDHISIDFVEYVYSLI